MNQIYDLHLWGGRDTDFYSGAGSHQLDIIEPYIKVVTDFLASFNPPLIVCDLGCGDFNIGKQLLPFTKKYIAVDIVEPLIKRNRATFTADNLEFQCFDIAKDTLPNCDCIILRQVIQHLSNNEILQIVKKLRNYKYVILTEHLPIGDFTPNKNIISGQGIRIKQQSGVDLLQPPFNLKVKSEQHFGSHILEGNKGLITTKLFTLF
ncbi:class I SAM-dependent methyltransferase [Algibacter mikhailovii]|nr:class I SAM-dependent methyltransferase [Algibacter mikhailovii]